jgi:antirestriction protein ArdC
MGYKPKRWKKGGTNKNGDAPAKRLTNAECYDHVMAQVLDAMKQGVMPWAGAHAIRAHHNAVSGHVYSGSNVLTTWVAAQAAGFETTGWVTYEAAAKLVRGTNARILRQDQGQQKSTKILHFRIWEKETTDASGKKTKEAIPLARLVPVFNLDQLSDAPVFEALRAKDRGEIASLRAKVGTQDEEFDRLITGTGAAVIYGAGTPKYLADWDTIDMPQLSSYHSVPRFYSDLAHQLVHWTGHKSRLNRPVSTGGPFEDMIAEMGAAFLMARMGYEFDGDHARHLAGWVQMLDSAGHGAAKLIVDAARYATKAVELLAPKGSLAQDQAPAAGPLAIAPAPVVADPVDLATLPSAQDWDGDCVDLADDEADEVALAHDEV